jgi:hypothetical protein
MGSFNSLFFHIPPKNPHSCVMKKEKKPSRSWYEYHPKAGEKKTEKTTHIYMFTHIHCSTHIFLSSGTHIFLSSGTHIFLSSRTHIFLSSFFSALME